MEPMTPEESKQFVEEQKKIEKQEKKRQREAEKKEVHDFGGMVSSKLLGKPREWNGHNEHSNAPGPTVKVLIIAPATNEYYNCTPAAPWKTTGDPYVDCSHFGIGSTGALNSKAQTEINNLKNSTIAAYSNSGVNVTFQFDTITALGVFDPSGHAWPWVNPAMFGGHDPNTEDSPSFLQNMPASSTLNTTRNYNAYDVVVLYRHGRTGFTACGTGFIGGYNYSAFNKSQGFAVVNYSTTPGTICPGSLVMAHELGHVFGLDHDHQHGGGAQPHYPIGWGFGVDGTWGDTMSYYSPRYPRFSDHTKSNCGPSANLACGAFNGTLNDWLNNASAVIALNGFTSGGNFYQGGISYVSAYK